MKKILAFILAIIMLLSMTGCQEKPADPTDQSSPGSGTPVQYRAQYIRTNGSSEAVLFPSVRIIRSQEELQQYYTTWHEVFDLERDPDPGTDHTIGFLDACDPYDEAFFTESFLILVLLEEGSGSIHHQVQAVEQTADNRLSISIDRKVPEAGTCDMAQWHIILELSREVTVENTGKISVILDGAVSYADDTVVLPQPEAAFKKPPQGMLVTPEGQVPLHTGGYSWFYATGTGSEEAVIADQSERPLPKGTLKPVTISSQYAETVYAPVPGSDTYAPTNSLGYPVKLSWETDPDSVTYTCWPDTVWQSSSIPEEAVVSQDLSFYAKHGSYVYEITATWEDTGSGCHGTASYYVHITDADGQNAVHYHMTALQPQTVADPITGYCGNTQTTLHANGKDYTFYGSPSVTLTDILVNLDYDPDKICRCMPQYTVDTEILPNYHIHLEYGFARCEKGQAELTQEQVARIAEIVKWAETTNCEVSFGSADTH